MKKKIIIRVFIIVIVTALVIIWTVGRKKVLMENVDALMIEKIVIYNTKDITITEKADIEKIVDIFQSMKLTKTMPTNKDGFAYMIEVHYTNGERNDITMTSEYIMVDGDTYKSDKDYCDDIREIYERLAEF